MLIFIYEILLWIAALIMLPKVIYQRIFLNKYKASLGQRCGIDFPCIDKCEKPLIWLHAVSVGETKAAAALIMQLRQQLDAVLIVSSITETGQAEAKRSIPEADYYVYSPFDAYAIITPIVNRIRPDYVIISETDLWLNFLRASKNRGAYIALVNGKISERSTRRLKSFSIFAKKLFGYIDHFCLQNEIYKERFCHLGIREEKIVVTGNLKFDSAPQAMTSKEENTFRKKLTIASENYVIVIGSTHDPEEKMLLKVFKDLLLVDKKMQLIIVPRHPERFESVAQLLCHNNIAFCRYSDNDKESKDPSQVILVDCMGVLNKCYQIAHLAIVGGSFTDAVGGHNILEPLWFNVPTIFGPYMDAQPELLAVVKHYGAGLQLPLEGLAANIPALLRDQVLRSRLQIASHKLICEMGGSTIRTLSELI